jgi:hypothetical protein
MKTALAWGCVVLVCLIGGCPNGGIVDNPAAVLEGTWQVTLDEPGDLEGFDIEVTFDNDGQLVEITAESPEGGTGSLDVDDSTTTEVDGDDVTVSIPAAGGARVLEGTLSEDEDTITGTLSQELELPSGDLDVTLPGSGLTLTRIE